MLQKTCVRPTVLLNDFRKTSQKSFFSPLFSQGFSYESIVIRRAVDKAAAETQAQRAKKKVEKKSRAIRPRFGFVEGQVGVLSLVFGPRMILG